MNLLAEEIGSQELAVLTNTILLDNQATLVKVLSAQVSVETVNGVSKF